MPYERLAYVSGPYRAPTAWRRHQNIENAKTVGLDLLKMGYAVHVPHANTAHMDGELPDEAFLQADLTVLRRCDLIVLVPGWRASSGAKAEVEEARRLGIPVYEWAGEGVLEPLDPALDPPPQTAPMGVVGT